ncbi:MAG: hypothetical protein QNJ46_14270 [Leptolyngbyaceae cyanobacterium MO_188.B28]|nr:hypothetical protein [Leptolyngbyaceae cyanobacterium MO_188.B28]
MPLPTPQNKTPAQQFPDADGLSWYVAPETVKQLLALVSANWGNPELADSYMNQALTIAGEDPDVLVSAYRYFFYTHNNTWALKVATKVLKMVERMESLPKDWPQLKPVLSNRRDDPNIRLYINAYASSGLIRARLGEIESAKEIAAQVGEIENRNEFGGNVVRDILAHPDGDDEADES